MNPKSKIIIKLNHLENYVWKLENDINIIKNIYQKELRINQYQYQMRLTIVLIIIVAISYFMLIH